MKPASESHQPHQHYHYGARTNSTPSEQSDTPQETKSKSPEAHHRNVVMVVVVVMPANRFIPVRAPCLTADLSYFFFARPLRTCPELLSPPDRKFFMSQAKESFTHLLFLCCSPFPLHICPRTVTRRATRIMNFRLPTCARSLKQRRAPLC